MEGTTEQVEQLIMAAGGRATELATTVEEIGTERVVALIVEELVFRSRVPTNTHLMLVQLDLTHNKETFTYTLSVQEGHPTTAAEGSRETAIARIEFELTELIRALYGSPRQRDAGTHRTQLLLNQPTVWAAYKDLLKEAWSSIGLAIDTVLSGCSSRYPDLGELSVRHGSDKWGTLHWFTPHYERHLRDLRNEPIRILEIGIGGYKDPDSGGQSLLMWKSYFPRGIITGIDIFAKHGLDQARIRTVQGDQNDPTFLQTLATQHGPFDIIIDDGSHINEHILTSFNTLFPHLRPGGFYVIEDLATTYWPGFGGAEGPVSPPHTSIGMLKSLLDHLHYQERPGDPGDPPAEHIVGVHAYHNLAFIEKGVNAEGAVPDWIPRSFDELLTGPE